MMRRVSVVGMLIGGAVLAATPAAATETVRANYVIHLIGLPLGTANMTSVLEPGSYRIDLNAKLTGIAAMISSSKAAGAATGSLVGGRIAATSYATTSANSQQTRTVRISMNAGTVKAAEIAPPWQELPGRIPVLEQHKRNIVDPLSALLMPVPGNEPVVGPAACNRTLPVYDGWARFDIQLSYEGKKTIESKGYSGEVAVCSVRYVPVAGHRPDRPGTKFMADNRDMQVWLAPVGTTRFVMPYRISVATMIGATIIEATSFNAGPSTRAASR
jgi:hypothetical protein